jgi:hypothetical protein
LQEQPSGRTGGIPAQVGGIQCASENSIKHESPMVHV